MLSLESLYDDGVTMRAKASTTSALQSGPVVEGQKFKYLWLTGSLD